MIRERRVYFARCIGPTGQPLGAIKIGCSYGYEKRLVSIGNRQPYSLELITTVPGHLVMEKACHLYLRNHQIDGEYFHENDVVMRFVNAAVERGSAFNFFTSGDYDHLPSKAVEAFMEYHGVKLSDVCKSLGVPLKRYENRLDGKFNSTIIASAALICAARGHYSNWPGDAMRGLLGERSPRLPKIDTEKSEEAA